MTVYFDTSALLPVLLNRHQNHQLATQLLQRCIKGAHSIITVTHTYGELYRHLTRNVPPFELSPARAQYVLLEVLPKIVRFTADAAAYPSAVRRCGQLDLRSSIVYDAVHLQAAVTGGAQVLYTDNTKDFRRLLTPDDDLRIEGIR